MQSTEPRGPGCADERVSTRKEGMGRMQVLAPGYLCQRSLRGLLTTKFLLGMNNGHLKNNGLIFGINLF